jgi:1,4-dihydroxy-2-naphthoate octaprenyltransferase
VLTKIFSLKYKHIHPELMKTEPKGTQHMENEEVTTAGVDLSPAKVGNAPHVVMADSVAADEVPTISIKDLQTISELQPAVSVHSVASTKHVSMPAPLVVQPAEYRRSIGEWLQIWRDGMRPAYLTMALMPALLGSVLAWVTTITHNAPFGQFHPTHFLAMLCSLIFIQTGANLLNDYYDYLRGADTSNPLGPGGLIQQGLIKPARVLIIGLTVLTLGAAVGVYAALAGGPVLFLFGVIGIVCAYFYSATSRSLASLGLGELVAFCLYGPLITIGAYLVQRTPSNIVLLDVFLFSMIPGFFAVATLQANNVRDIEGDAHANKQTLSVLIGIRWSKMLYVLFLLVPYLVLFGLGVPSGAPHLMLIAAWTIPGMIVTLSGLLRSDIMQSLHIVMRQTIRLEVNFILLLLIGLIAAAIIPVAPEIPLHILR